MSLYFMRACSMQTKQTFPPRLSHKNILVKHTDKLVPLDCSVQINSLWLNSQLETRFTIGTPGWRKNRGFQNSMRSGCFTNGETIYPHHVYLRHFQLQLTYQIRKSGNIIYKQEEAKSKKFYLPHKTNCILNVTWTIDVLYVDWKIKKTWIISWAT